MFTGPLDQPPFAFPAESYGAFAQRSSGVGPGVAVGDTVVIPPELILFSIAGLQNRGPNMLADASVSK